MEKETLLKLVNQASQNTLMETLEIEYTHREKENAHLTIGKDMQ